MSDDRPRVDITAAQDEVTRREILRRAAAGAVVLVYGGFGAKSAVAGAPKFRGKELKGTLRILQWSHFVPAYDQWFDNQYTKRWGQANDTDVTVDHVNQADLPGRVAAEAAAGKGHDIVALLAPAPQYEDRVIVYDAVGLSSAGRAWWMLRLFDHDNVALLDGGLPKWKADGRPLETAAAAIPHRRFTPVFGPDQLPDRPLGPDRLEADELGPRAEGSAEAARNEPPDRDRHVERDRFEHGPDGADDVLRVVHPER